MKKNKLLTILGPTAVGKTRIAAHLAYKNNCEIISADSRQVYKNMTIGTGKDIKEYIINNTKINTHLIDIVNPGYEYNVFEFKKDFDIAIEKILSKNKTPMLCGGTGLYIQSVLHNFNMIKTPVNETLRKELSELSIIQLTEQLKKYKKLHNTTDTTDKNRLIRAIEIEKHKKNNSQIESQTNTETTIFGIFADREIIKKRITERLKYRLNNGMIEEVEMLLNSGLTPIQLKFYGLEYKFVTMYITGELNYNDMYQKLNAAIHQFAKRQMTFFRKIEREYKPIHWIDGTLPLSNIITQIMQKWEKTLA